MDSVKGYKFKIGDRVVLNSRLKGADGGIYGNVMEDQKRDGYVTITGLDTKKKYDGWYRVNDWVDPDLEYTDTDNFLFDEEDMTEIPKVKATNISRTFYKNKIIEEKNGELWLKE